MKAQWIARIGVVAVIVVGIAASISRNSDPRPAAASTPEESIQGTALRIGSISNEPGNEAEVFQPFADYLAAQLGHVGVGRGQIVVARDIGTMHKLLSSGAVDLYVDSPFPILTMERDDIIRIVARRWKEGVAEYHSVLFARKDSSIRDVAGLGGRVVAFEEPFSTSSYLLPKASLLEYGLALVQIPTATTSVPADRVGFVFSNDDDNTVYWVLKGKVAAGAINDQVFRSLPPAQRDELIIIHQTATVPRQLVGIRRDVDPDVATALTTVLLKMHTVEDGRRVLADFDKTTRFDDFDTLTGSAMASLARLARLVSVELGGTVQQQGGID
jgi:phosphonate transport system substrate-binding protein